MAEVSQITDMVRQTVELPIQPWFKNHFFAGKMILPGVETLLILADAAKEFNPASNSQKMFDVRFDKILQLDPNETLLKVFVEIDTGNSDSITAKLLTKNRTKAFSRIFEHGRVTFITSQVSAPKTQPAIMPIDLDGPFVTVPSKKIYQELVPFGKAYQNIVDDLYLSDNGVWARLRVPELPGACINEQCGSPFPLDAAFHAACVWGQRYVGFIPFPIGFSSRTISKLTVPGNIYETIVIPIVIKSDEIVFDLWILNCQGEVYETVCGIRMRDISGGRLKPPAWIQIDTEALL